MENKVVYKKRFQNNLLKLLNYLETEWNRNIADDFVSTLVLKISVLSTQPNIGIRSAKLKNARSILVTKHNRLIYKLKGNTLIIIDLRDTRMNPKKYKY